MGMRVRMRTAVPVLVVLAWFAVLVVVPFMRVGFLIRMRMRVSVAVSVIMSSVAVVSETCHTNQVYSQSQATYNKQLH